MNFHHELQMFKWSTMSWDLLTFPISNNLLLPLQIYYILAQCCNSFIHCIAIDPYVTNAIYTIFIQVSTLFAFPFESDKRPKIWSPKKKIINRKISSWMHHWEWVNCWKCFSCLNPNLQNGYELIGVWNLWLN